jgi:hypothetical protein
MNGIFINFLVSALVFFITCFAFGEDQISSAGPVPKMKGVTDANYSESIYEDGGTLAYGHNSINLMTLSMPIPAGTPFTTLLGYSPPNFASSIGRWLSNGTWGNNRIG